MNDDLISRKAVLGLARDICVPTKEGTESGRNRND